jgi:uncharacterized protein YndB with AHSA1/START domain
VELLPLQNLQIMQKKPTSSPVKRIPVKSNRSVSSTRNWKFIKASPENLYRVFTNPDDLAAWQAPGKMTGKVHHFDLRVGGGYRMSLFYPLSEKKTTGKTTAREDRFKARFLELSPSRKIVQAVTFDSDDPAFSGEMIMEVTFGRKATGTRVTLVFKNIPPGIKPEDNKTGTRLSLEKLARYVESGNSKAF